MLAKIKILFLTVLNWEKWNPRKDLKTTSWFRFQNTLFEDPQFDEFNHSELLFFIYLLSLASKKQSGDIDVHIAHAQRIGRFETSTINSAIKKLIEINCVRTRDVDVTHTHADVPLRTNVTNERNVTNEHTPATDAPRSRLVFDFESVYKIYPRKLGKAEGIARLSKMITTQEQFDALLKAVKNYAEACRVKGTEEKYIRHFDTFVGPIQKPAWTDFIDYNPKTGTAPKRDYSYLQE